MNADPRLPYAPKGENVTVDWIKGFLARMYDWCREIAQEIDSRFEALENYAKQGADAASANNLTVGEWGRVRITGATPINLLASRANAAILVLHFVSNPLVKHNQAASGDFKPIYLAAGVDLATAAKMQVTLQYDTTDATWYQI